MARAGKLKPGFMFTLAYDILNKKKRILKLHIIKLVRKFQKCRVGGYPWAHFS